MVKFEQNAKTWDRIHRKAGRVRSSEDKKKFIKYIKKLYKVMDCEVCKSHTKKFMKTYPINEYETYIDDDGIDRGLLRWTWIFHNDVNIRLGKKEYRWSETVKRYSK